MSNFDDKVSQLQGKLIKIIAHQEQFQREIAEIRAELSLLKSQAKVIPTSQRPETPEALKANETFAPNQTTQTEQEKTYSSNQEKSPPKYQSIFNKDSKPVSETKIQRKSNLEKFIGENLISKIGIIILVIGVGIGAKYAIDNNWITPLMRIVSGYAFGIILVGLAVRLKAKYLNFSAVLLSGGMAIMYFITFFAYTFYALINQPTAFILMMIFTAFTVASALNYDRQVIAHIGLVGAYSIPFLLSDDSGNYAFLFSYIAIINIGILAISVKKYWKPLFYSSYIVTWLIFFGWYATKYSAESHFYLGMFFLSAFFLIFYLTFIAYKLVSKENIAVENIALILANSFIFYGFGYSMLENREGFGNLLGMFTMINAAIHFAFAFTISRLKLATKDLLYLTAALVLTFITIAIPVQLDGNFVTLIWAAEAAILFWIGRTKQIPLFENYSYPLMFIGAISILHDWAILYLRYFDKEESIYPIFNQYFVIGIFFVAAFAFIWILNRKKEFASSLPEEFSAFVNFIISAILLFVIYNIFRIEIGNFFSYQFLAFSLDNPGAKSYLSSNSFSYNILWQMNYTMLFLMILSFINIGKFQNAILGFINILLNGLTVTFFITIGLFILGDLRRNYLFPNESVETGIFSLLIRYVCYAFFAAISFATYKYTKQKFLTDKVPAKILNILFDLGFYFSVLVLSSVELLTWMDIFDFNESTKLGLSILWGIYALFLIVLGIILKKVHLRIFAITLFTVTLLKLFFYDIADLDTISKTVVFVSLGILLLIISFLYTKYRNLIFDDVKI